MNELGRISKEATRQGLCINGAFHSEGAGSIVLLGPDEPGGFWDRFATSPEGLDGQPDPMNRWSERVISGFARDLDAKAHFPFGGPPWQPFHQWAIAGGACFSSPVGLLVHAQAGLWVSFRGALEFDHRLELPAAQPNPCDTCCEKPCINACPVGALGAGHDYDVPVCKTYLATPSGAGCMTDGCQVRAACPVSQGWGRKPAQSAFHMEAFRGT